MRSVSNIVPGERRRDLILVRHGESEFNQRNLFTGWLDPGLTPKGVAEAQAVGRRLNGLGFRFQCAFSSALRRARESSLIILAELGQRDLVVAPDEALNERDYGELSGLNKDEARRRWGEEQIALWRRSYDASPPGGESLKGTSARVLPYYVTRILPQVMRGQATLVIAHGNSLRALIMVLECLDRKAISRVEIATGEVRVYELAADTIVTRKQILTA